MVIVPLSVLNAIEVNHLKMIEIANVILHIFYHNILKGKKFLSQVVYIRKN